MKQIKSIYLYIKNRPFLLGINALMAYVSVAFQTLTPTETALLSTHPQTLLCIHISNCALRNLLSKKTSRLKFKIETAQMFL